MAGTNIEREDALEMRSVPLGGIEPARSRHMWTRSAVSIAESGDLVVTGEWDGTVTARETDSLESRWTAEHPDHAVGIAPLGDAVVVAGRGETGTIAAYDAATGDRRWRYDTAADVGEAVKDTVFYLPYVVACETDTDADGTERLYAAARRYERDGDVRRWHSTVYAFAPDGTRLATGPIHGSGWRHPLAVAPLGPAGEPELAVVRKPHVEHVLEFYRLDGSLTVEATLPGFRTHTYGSRNLDGALAADLDADGAVEVLVPTTSRTELAAVRRSADGAEVAWRLSLDGGLRTNVTGVTLDGGVAVGAGTPDGVRVWQG
jgi:outer membrane protein assembly factor BamB